MGNSASVQVHPSGKVQTRPGKPCDCSRFTRIDNYVREISTNHHPESVSDLVDVLRRGANGQLELLRSFYTWVTHNVSLDERLPKLSSNADVSGVMKTGRSNSYGICKLFMEICKEANIENRLIVGHLKDTSQGYRSRGKASFPDHYWTQVLLDNTWKIIDCACGASKVDRKGQRTRNASGFYFIPKPEHFIVHHLPHDDNGSLQLLDTPIDQSTFELSAVISDEAMTCGIMLVSHGESKIVVHKETEVVIKDSNMALSSFHVEFTCRSIDLGDLKHYTFVKMEDRGVYETRIKPPLVGMYDLVISGKTNTNVEIPITRYSVYCDKVYPFPKPFPMWRPLWGLHPSLGDFGFDEKTRFGANMTVDSGELECKIPVQRDVEVKSRLSSTKSRCDDFIKSISDGGSVTIVAKFPKSGFYCLELFCSKDKEDEIIHPVISSFIECKMSQNPCQMFYNDDNEVWV